MIYDPVTNEPYEPTLLEQAEDALRSVERWALRSDDALTVAMNEELRAYWTAEVERLRGLQRAEDWPDDLGGPQASRESGQGSPGRVSRAATGHPAPPSPSTGVERAAVPGAGAGGALNPRTEEHQ